MKSFAVAAMAGVAAANPAMLYPRGNSTTAGNGGVVYTTEVVTAYTTYCPGPTEVVVGDKTHTVTEATTLTITDCPCTITKPVMPTGTSPVTKTKDHEVYTTKVVTAYTTYCPAPTEVVIGTKTHTVTEPTTLTVTDCPCTVTEPVNPGETGVNPGNPGETGVNSGNPGETNTPAADDCAAACNKALGECKAQADANQSTCISEYSKCLGYDWSAGDREYATACASGQATNTPPVIVQPSGTKPPAVVETGAAAALKPVGGVVAALAAVAML